MNISARIATELRGDRVIWAIIVLLGIISMAAVFSSVSTLAYTDRDGEVSFYLMKHGAFLGFGWNHSRDQGHSRVNFKFTDGDQIAFQTYHPEDYPCFA